MLVRLIRTANQIIMEGMSKDQVEYMIDRLMDLNTPIGKSGEIVIKYDPRSDSEKRSVKNVNGDKKKSPLYTTVTRNGKRIVKLKRHWREIWKDMVQHTRKDKGLTQERIAELIGITRDTYNRNIEHAEYGAEKIMEYADMIKRHLDIDVRQYIIVD